jgi:hypothetical protein
MGFMEMGEGKMDSINEPKKSIMFKIFGRTWQSVFWAILVFFTHRLYHALERSVNYNGWITIGFVACIVTAIVLFDEFWGKK